MTTATEMRTMLRRWIDQVGRDAAEAAVTEWANSIASIDREGDIWIDRTHWLHNRPDQMAALLRWLEATGRIESRA